MIKEERKAAVAAYKERSRPAGIFLVRCTATGERWIGQNPDLEAIRNRLLWRQLLYEGECAIY